MTKLTQVFVLIFVALLLINGCSNKADDAKESASATTTESAEDLTLSSLQGKVVVIDFWATWCPPCRKGIPDLIELKKEYDQLEIVGISLDAISQGGRTKDDVVPFMKEYGINYPIVMGDQDVTMQFGNIQSIPTSFVIDRRGFVVNHHVGLVSKEELKADIDKALAGTYDREDYVKAPDFTLPVIK